MAECEESSCIKRYYQFKQVNGEYQAELQDYERSDAAGIKGPITTLSEANKTLAVAAIDAALRNREKNGKQIKKCPDGCRCPPSTPPKPGDPVWSENDPEALYSTTFPSGALTFTIRFKIDEMTADIERRCKPKEEKISYDLERICLETAI